MRQHQESRFPVIPLLGALLSACAVSILMLLLIALLMYRTGISSGTTSLLVTITYVLSPFVGGFLLGKKVKEKRFLWGLLLAVLYFCVYVLFSLLVSGTQDNSPGYFRVMLAVLPGGILGGMLS